MLSKFDDHHGLNGYTEDGELSFQEPA